MNIQAVAQRTGVPAATLRKWEQRYGVLKPERTAGSHRRYSERDISRVEWLKARLAEGYRIGEAARLIGGGSNGEVPTDGPGLVAEIVAATVGEDVERTARALEQAFTLMPPERAIADVAEPALRQIGALWERGEARVVDEHVLTELTRAKVRALMDGGIAGTRGRAVLCCVPGERHDLGLVALGVLLHADGWSIVYCGADTPLAEAAALAASREAAVLCVSATMPDLAAEAEADLAAVAERHPGLEIVRGGPAFGGEPATSIVRRLRRRAAPATRR
jgi:MerR family transcriptional regulator, light-induced transcriptional regulator